MAAAVGRQAPVARRGRRLLRAVSRRRLAVLANSLGDLAGDVLVCPGVRDLHQLERSQPVVALLLVADVLRSQPPIDAAYQPVTLLADHCGRGSTARLEQLLIDRGVGSRLRCGDVVGGLLPFIVGVGLGLGVRLVDSRLLLLLRELNLAVLVECRGVELSEIDARLRRDEIDGSSDRVATPGRRSAWPRSGSSNCSDFIGYIDSRTPFSNAVLS